MLDWRDTRPSKAAKSRATVLLAVAHLGGQHAGGNRTDARQRQKPLAEVTLSQLATEFLINLGDLSFLPGR